MDKVITRRALVSGGLVAGALVSVGGLFSEAAYADLPPLDPNDPAARGRDYVIKSAKSIAYCGNCSLYKKTADSVGSCALFAGKSVAFAGWCSGWVKIGAV
jgi:hypothetical protein